MEYVMNLLAGLGDHFVLIAVGCIEAAVATVFVGMQLGKNAKSLRKKLALEGAEQIFLEKSADRTDECCIVMENEGKLPIYASGDLEGLMGVTLEGIQQDLLSMGRKMMDLRLAIKDWQRYLEWDGTGRFQCEI